MVNEIRQSARGRSPTRAGRRNFAKAISGVLGAAAVAPRGASRSRRSAAAPKATVDQRQPRVPTRKIPIGVFDPVYAHLSLDAMLDKVSALGLEAMEIGTGGYPNNRHCPLDDLIKDRAAAKAWQKKFEDRGIRV